MDNKEEKNYIEFLKEEKEKLKGITIPTMGMMDNEEKIGIEGKDYLIEKDNQKEK